ncbi:MAG: sporulation protein [Eubacterium sp.]|nr:sporulation protein [Eubacterium sp.]
MADQIKKNDFNQTVSTLFKGMDAFLTTKTVVGDPISIGDTTIIPLVDVNFGVGAGAMGNAKGTNNAGGGMGGKLSPTAAIVIQDGVIRMMPVSEESTLSKVLDMVPGVVSKVQDFVNKKKKEEKEAVEEAVHTLPDEEF